MKQLFRPTMSTISALSLAVFTLWAFLTLSALLRKDALEALPASHWFEVKSVNVASHAINESEVPVVYDRVIHEAFVGNWFAEIHEAETGIQVCAGEGRSRYEPSDRLPAKNIVTLDWYMGRKCVLALGRYVLKTTYKIYTDEEVIKILDTTSNIFEVKQASAIKTP